MVWKSCDGEFIRRWSECDFETSIGCLRGGNGSRSECALDWKLGSEDKVV